MKIEGHFELLALHRCLFEAKFNACPDDYDIAGSPIVAKLANEVLASLKEIEGDKWEEWRIFENHKNHISNLIKALKKQNLNHVKNKGAEVQFIVDALAPLSANEEQINEVIIEVFGS